jgi:hypothetical protein
MGGSGFGVLIDLLNLNYVTKPNGDHPGAAIV